MLKHQNIKIYGQVHGVFFRDSAHRKAGEFSIKGFVRNDPDDTVYIEAEGEEKDLEKFLEWCRRGPDSARVERVKVEEGQIEGFLDFSVEL